MDSPHDDAVCVDAGHPEHEDGGGDEHDVETGQTNQNAVHRVLHLGPSKNRPMRMQNTEATTNQNAVHRVLRLGPNRKQPMRMQFTEFFIWDLIGNDQ